MDKSSSDYKWEEELRDRRDRIIDRNTKQLQKWLSKRKDEESQKALRDSNKNSLIFLCFILIIAFITTTIFLTYNYIQPILDESTEVMILIVCLINIFLLPIFIVLIRPIVNLPRRHWFCFIHKASKYLKKNNSKYSKYKITSFNLKDENFAKEFIHISQNNDFEQNWNTMKTPSYFLHELEIVLIGLLFIFILYGGIFVCCCLL